MAHVSPARNSLASHTTKATLPCTIDAEVDCMERAPRADQAIVSAPTGTATNAPAHLVHRKSRIRLAIQSPTAISTCRRYRSPLHCTDKRVRPSPFSSARHPRDSHADTPQERTMAQPRRLRLLCSLLALIFLLNGTASESQQHGIPIPYDGRTIGFVEIVGIANDETNSRLSLDLSARFPEFPRELDRAMAARRNLGSNTHRLFWAGGTRIVGSGSVLRMATRLRYEWWPDLGFGRTRALRDTKTVDWHAFVVPNQFDKLEIGLTIDNIRGLGNDIERLLGARITRQTGINLPARCGACSCDEIFAEVRPTAEAVRFSHDSRNVTLRTTISLESNLPAVTRCFGN